MTYDDIPQSQGDNFRLSGAKLASVSWANAMPDALRNKLVEDDLKVQGVYGSKRVKFAQEIWGEEGKSLNVAGEDEETSRLRRENESNLGNYLQM